MSGGEIKMLATVSESTYTRLYRELAALPERKRVKRLIVLAQIGQIAEMAAMGHQLLPAQDLPSPAVPTVAAPNVAVAPEPATPTPPEPAPAAPEQTPAPAIEPVAPPPPPAESERPGTGDALAENVIAAGHQRPTTEATTANEPIHAQQPSAARKPRRSGHGFKVGMT